MVYLSKYISNIKLLNGLPLSIHLRTHYRCKTFGSLRRNRNIVRYAICLQTSDITYK